jgi:hypothetical protein
MYENSKRNLRCRHPLFLLHEVHHPLWMAIALLWIGLQRQYYYGYTLGILSDSFYQRYSL